MIRRSIPLMGSIPPGVRLGISVGLGAAENVSTDPAQAGLSACSAQAGKTFRPTMAKPAQSLEAAKRGVAAEIHKLNKTLADILSHADGDEHMAREAELLLAHLQRLADAL